MTSDKSDKYKGDSKEDIDDEIDSALYQNLKLVKETRDKEEEEEEEEEEEKFLGLLFLDFWIKSFNFSGRTNRRDYWMTLLAIGCAYLIAAFFYLLFLSAFYFEGFYFEGFVESFGWTFVITTFIPNLAIQVRRLNDIGKAPAWVLLSFVPFLSLILIFWYTKPSLKNKSTSKSELELNNKNQFNNLDKAEERLEKLKGMLKKDLITSEEFEKLKRKILGL